MLKALRLLMILFLAGPAAIAQTAGISGSVKTADGDPLPGVTVLVKDTNVGTTTDSEGFYRLAKTEGTLVFSFVGYKSQEIEIGTRSVIDVVLEDDTQLLNEVVVVGYGMQNKKDVTGAIAVVSGKEMEDRPNSQFGNLIQGKTAGVQVISPSGKPSQGFSIRIRGTTSISSSSEPLYVVDGVPISDTRNLNPADIETFSILKDASASAIYGTQGANGVVLITTKKGKEGKARVEMNVYGGFSDVWKTKRVLNSEQYRDLMTEMGQTTDWSQYNQNTNWQDQIFQRGSQQNYQLNVSGKNNNTTYYVSGGWVKQDGAVRSATMNRYTFKTSLETKLNNIFTVGTNLNYMHYNDVDVTDNTNVNSGGVLLGVLTTPPNIGVYKANGQFTSNPFQEWENPVASTDGSKRGYTTQRVLGNAYAEATILPNLKVRSNIGIDYNNSIYDYFLDPYLTSYGRQNNGLGTNSTTTSNYFIFDNTINYQKNFGDHNFNLLGGVVIQNTFWQNNSINVKGFSGTAVTTTNGASSIIGATNDKADKANRSFLGRLTYDYQGKYLLTANFRADGSSAFGKSRKTGYFPSVSGGWRISSESFMSNVKAISDLKIRAGWGIVGNDQIGNYPYQGLVGTGANYTIGGVIKPGTYPASINNDAMHWEQTEQTNIGIDVGVLSGRITFSVDAYLKKTSDLLLNIPIPKATGFDTSPTNAGSIQNKGLEFNITSQNLVSGPVQWETNFNISFNRNKVLSILGQQYVAGGVSNRENVSYTQAGQPMGMFYGYTYAGVDPATGQAFYVGADGNGTFTPNSDTDRKIIGNPNPKFIFGMTNNVSWKNFSLNVFLQGTYGNDIYNATKVELEGMSDQKNQGIEVLNRWRKPGDITDIPKASFGSIDNSRTSTRFIEDGSYLRIKQVTLGYTLPTAIIAKAGLSKVRVYVTGENLFTITKYSGFDPEVNFGGTSNTTLGIDYGTYPQTRNIIFGANLTF